MQMQKNKKNLFFIKDTAQTLGSTKSRGVFKTLPNPEDRALCEIWQYCWICIWD